MTPDIPAAVSAELDAIVDILTNAGRTDLVDPVISAAWRAVGLTAFYVAMGEVEDVAREAN